MWMWGWRGAGRWLAGGLDPPHLGCWVIGNQGRLHALHGVLQQQTLGAARSQDHPLGVQLPGWSLLRLLLPWLHRLRRSGPHQAALRARSAATG